ncbi:hypothetical protein LUZ63_005964 [Rhynchospora breviuscula]|uniref:NB-ARC domain-containing protein n=1 Tax=Rhynchospora breviuscula TaxID=2022672 RepID=A0A9Q0HT24_9POAL|nr:hypothetical protein LUZ63_005964 [Rhynchospora breviuscula]
MHPWVAVQSSPKLLLQYLTKDVVKSFGKPLWITVSQKYEPIEVLENIARKLEIIQDWEVNVASQIRKSLGKKRYLIVLDDVWNEKVWAEIVKVLPDKKNGSRVLFTTRIENVAKWTDTTYEPYRLPLLDEEQSLELFLKNAVPKMHWCSSGILDADQKGLAKEFVTRCEGLPLALEVLGSLLSKTKCNYHAWNKVLQTLSWHYEGCERINTITASYEHLPLAKKLCFLYFAAFPEDIKIDAKSLLRIWVAERLIPDEVNRTLEETAECFLEDLVQRSLVQVSKRFPDGSIKSCRVHDVLRDLAIHKAKEMNFLMVCSKEDDWRSCSTVIDDMLEMLPPHLTELSPRGFEFVSDPMPMLEKLRSLNTLHISVRGAPDPSTIRRIKCSAGAFEQLEELLLEDLKVEEWEIEMGAMPMLKRLRIRDCSPLSVPPALIHFLDRLQYLHWVTNIQADKDAINNIFKQRPHQRSYWDVFGDRFYY